MRIFRYGFRQRFPLRHLDADFSQHAAPARTLMLFGHQMQGFQQREARLQQRRYLFDKLAELLAFQ